MTTTNAQGPLAGKKVLVTGVANDQSIAWGCAAAFKALGAELAITYLNDKARTYVEPLAQSLDAALLLPLDVTQPGEAIPRLAAPAADLRTDLPRYRVWADGRLIDEPTQIADRWRDDLVSFLIGCSFTFERALLDAEVPVRHLTLGVNVPRIRSISRVSSLRLTCASGGTAC